MKKIIMTAKHLDAGGVETFITGIYPYIDKEKYSIDFLITKKEDENDPKGYFEDELVSQGAKVFRISSKSSNMIRAYRDLKTFFTEHKEYDIFHINDGGGAAFPLYVANKFSKCKFIVHSHNADSKKWKQNIVMTLFRGYVKSKAYCIGCSNKAAEWMFGRNSDYAILHYGIDTAKFKYNQTARETIRKQYAIKDNEYVIGNVGRFNVQKNHSFMIDIFHEYHTRDVNSKLMLIGSGELEQDIRKKINDYGLRDAVIFVGNTKQVEQYLSAMDLFLFPSLFEGLPIVQIEAQANGVPCLISDTITDEIRITDLVKTKSITLPASEWADDIEKIKTADRGNRSAYAQFVRDGGFDRQNTAKRIMDIYEEILK